MAALRALRLEGGGCGRILELLHDGAWGRVCANGTVEDGAAAVAAVYRELGCGAAGRLHAVPDWGSGPAWLGRVRCEEGNRSLWRCSSTPWRLRSCGPAGVTHVACDEDGSDVAGSPAPGSGCRDGDVCTGGSVEPSAPAAGRSPRGLTLPALSLSCPSAGRRAAAHGAVRAAGHVAVPGPGCPGPVGAPNSGSACRWVSLWGLSPLGTLGDPVTGVLFAGPSQDAGSEAVYEELDYSRVPECREGPGRAGGSGFSP